MIGLVALALAQDAPPAEAVEQRTFVRRPVAGRPVGELRIGAQSVDGSRPTICAEGNPLAWLSIEACGNGHGILHKDANAFDMAHFRARFRALHREIQRSEVDLLIGTGFAEVQAGEDAAGFRFGRQEAGSLEAAGAEASLSVKGRFYTTPGTFLSADVNAGAALIPGAPDVFGRGGPVVPFAQATIGLGF